MVNLIFGFFNSTIADLTFSWSFLERKIGSKYVEIKSTRSKLHKHIINGLNQLTVMPNTQKYLASYLGISPQHLSRLRKNI